MPKVPSTPTPKVIELADKINRLPAASRAVVNVAIARTPADKAAAISAGAELLKAQDPRDRQGVDTIRQYAEDLETLKSKESAAVAVLEDIEKEWPERLEVDRLEDELSVARDRLRSCRLTKTTYLAQTENVAKVRRDLKEARQILSTYLLFHYRRTGELQVLMDEASGDARQVVLTGKLGRKTKYQTSFDFLPDMPEQQSLTIEDK